MKVFGVTGWRNAGKTTLIERLIGRFAADGLRLATIKRAHHNLELDRPGKDSYRHWAAGAAEVLVSNGQRWALVHRLLPEEGEPTLDDLLARLSPADLVLVEGHKAGPHPKIEVYDDARGRPPIAAGNSTVRALATDAAVSGITVPLYARDDIDGIAAFIRGEMGL